MLAEEITRALERKGDRVRSEPIPTHFRDRIPVERRHWEIENSDVFLFLVSANSLDDEGARREFEHATRTRRSVRILPLLVGGISVFRELPDYLRPFHVQTVERGNISEILAAVDAMRPVKTVSFAFVILTTALLSVAAASTTFVMWSTRDADPRVIQLLGADVNRQAETTFFRTAVRVPEEHRVGNIERPAPITLWSWKIREDAEDKRKHFIQLPSVPMSKAEFLEELSSVPRNSVLLYVHGYNSEPRDACLRLSQIVWDTNYRGIPVFFRWQSRGELAGYKYDEDSAKIAREPLMRLIKDMQQHGVSDIHILAHSMGNQIVVDALAQLSSTFEIAPISELIMAAPDVDRDVMKVLAPKVRQFTRGMTLYASSSDKALQLSRGISQNPRAGDVPPVRHQDV